MLVREVVNFGSYWRSSTFSSTVEPTIYLLAFGFGFGSLVSTVAGYDYVEFVGTGTVATAVLFSSVFPAMFGTFVKYQFQHTYDAILAAPVDTEELVTGRGAVDRGARRRLRLRRRCSSPSSSAWTRAGACCSCPFIAFLAGFGWASFGIFDRGGHEVDRELQLRDSSIVITPLFLVAGTFFPIAGLPEWAQVAGQLQPAVPLRASWCATRSSASTARSTSGTWPSWWLRRAGCGARGLARMRRKLID